MPVGCWGERERAYPPPAPTPHVARPRAHIPKVAPSSETEPGQSIAAHTRTHRASEPQPGHPTRTKTRTGTRAHTTGDSIDEAILSTRSLKPTRGWHALVDGRLEGLEPAAVVRGHPAGHPGDYIGGDHVALVLGELVEAGLGLRQLLRCVRGLGSRPLEDVKLKASLKAAKLRRSNRSARLSRLVRVQSTTGMKL